MGCLKTDIETANSSYYYEDGTYRVLDKDELPVILPYDVSLEGKGNALKYKYEKSYVQKPKPAYEKLTP